MSSDEFATKWKRRLRRAGWTLLLVLAALLAVSWWKYAILIYSPPIDEVRLVVKPSPGDVVVRIPFPDALSERQVARLYRHNPDAFYFDLVYVLEHTVRVIGPDNGNLKRIALLSRGVESPNR